jgi:hypothetical protein
MRHLVRDIRSLDVGLGCVKFSLVPALPPTRTNFGESNMLGNATQAA